MKVQVCGSTNGELITIIESTKGIVATNNKGEELYVWDKEEGFDTMLVNDSIREQMNAQMEEPKVDDENTNCLRWKCRGCGHEFINFDATCPRCQSKDLKATGA